MSYEYMSGMGGVTYPGKRGGEYQPDAAECSSLQCPPGSTRKSVPGATYWSSSPRSTEEQELRIQQMRATREQQRALTEEGCVLLCTARSGNVRAGENSIATEYYCCPSNPDADTRYLEDYILRLKAKAPYPEGTRCHWEAGYGGRGQAVPQLDGTTRGWRDYLCDPTSGMSCEANLPIPDGCRPTGRWYNLTTKELCCPSAPATVVPSISLREAEAQAQAQAQQPVTQLPSPATTPTTAQQPKRYFGLTAMQLAFIGVGGVALYALLKR